MGKADAMKLLIGSLCFMCAGVFWMINGKVIEGLLSCVVATLIHIADAIEKGSDR